MKTSLLLLALAAGAAVTVTAHAADSGACHHTLRGDNALASAASVGHFTLPNPARLLSGQEHRTTSAGPSTHGDRESRATHGYPHRPGPEGRTTASHNDGSGHHGPHQTDAKAHDGTGNGGQPSHPASDEPTPTLGWQSLLPGSIQ